MKARKLLSKMPSCGREGFSLIELMVVIGILAILAFSVGAYINATPTKLKSFVFNTKMRFNQARFEAVKRSRNVYLDFDFDGVVGIDNGFTIWVDDNGDGAYVAADGDSIIETVEFVNKVSLASKHGPEIYAGPASASGGPGTDGPGDSTINDGVSAAGGVDYFRFKPDGDSINGTAYFYFPTELDGAKVVASGPWAIIVNSVGRIRVDEWRSTGGWQVNK
ncbi:MAG: GspH/FimT family pseudopilin [Thermodesulfobacteriota bacterium]